MSEVKAIMDSLDKIKTDMVDKDGLIDTRIAELTKNIKELELKFVESRGIGVSVPGVNDGKEQFSFRKAINGISTGSWIGAEYERDVFKETEKRAVQNASTDNLGGFLVPVQVSSDFIDKLRVKLIVDRLNFRTLSNLPSGIYEFNKKKSETTVYPRTELGRSERTGVEFTQIRMSPRMISAYVPMSERLVRTSSPSIEAIVQEDLMYAAKAKMEELIFFGKGGDAEPLGITKYSTILGGNNTGLAAGERHYFNADAANGRILTFEDCINLEGELADRNALPDDTGVLALATNHGVGRLMRTEKAFSYDASGASEAVKLNLPIRSGLPLTNAQVESITGLRQVHSNVFPISGANQGVYTGTYDNPATGTKKLSFGVYGDFSQAMLAIYQGMSLRASRDASDVIGSKFYSAFTQNQVWVQINMEMDLGIRQDESFVILNNLKTRRA